MKAILALEDGRVFEGRSFGAATTATGEISFHTAMSGYQEIITDPSCCGHLMALTYPHIGNGGIIPEDHESARPALDGLVISELSPITPARHQSLSDFLADHKVPGIERVDTRALATHLRKTGTLRACLSTTLDAAGAVQAAQNHALPSTRELVSRVSTAQTFHWEQDSRRYTLPNATTGVKDHWIDLPPVQFRAVVVDFGVKYNILRRLRQNGFDLEVVPFHTTAEEILALNPDGILLSNGPGNPADLTAAHAEIRKLLGHKPLAAIGLGTQLMVHALGGRTTRLKTGHHGYNIPVKDTRTGKVTITAQNHDFTIDPDSLPAELEISHTNLNDHTVEGIHHRTASAFGVLFQPESAPGPNDNISFFDEFAARVAAAK